MAATASQRQGDTTITRVTKEGRMLTYCLTVIQQPERARACGSGAKSSADRRPVDPPPVVELRIFEGEGAKEEDITFSYNANFFLFATLETARPMAHGRVQPSPPQIPVLTGMPVSGMAYLDRPTEAGYFIFPDLSVRHEGKYYLSFNLYEETKEDKDADAETEPAKPKMAGVPGAPTSSFDWRLEVKSAMFAVFSAKKFPGLAESTPLSRTVAEQGCRVRIRRDVRMRRRDKGPAEYDENPDDGYARIGRPAEPSHEPYRERSNSAASDDGQRRLSGEYPPQPYHHQFTPSPVMPTAPAGQGYLSFGASQGPPFQAPQAPFAAPPPPPPPSHPVPAPPSYQQQPATNGYRPAPPPFQHRAPPPLPPSSNYPYDRQPPQSAYPSNPPREQREADPFRRASAAATLPPFAAVPQPSPTLRVDPKYNQHPHQAPPSPREPIQLPPIREMDPSPNTHNLPLSSIQPPLSSPAFPRAAERLTSYDPSSAPSPPAEPARNGKRPFDDAFYSNTEQPLYNGMRPAPTDHSASASDAAGETVMDGDDVWLQYRRADGNSASRQLPPPTALIP